MTAEGPSTEALRLVPPRLPGIIFTLVLFAYMAAVTQRSSFGVAGVDAQARFDATATALASVAMMQVVVYALMQIPVGMLLDRYGPARLVICGAVLMAAGQVTVALAPSIELVVAGRVLVGIGDATTFVSGLRIISAWFRPRRVPVMQQWFGNFGQVGQFLSAVPFAALLHLSDWVIAFLTSASLSAIVFVACLVGLRDSLAHRYRGHPLSVAGAFRKLGDAFARPGTRLGFWSHFTTQFIGNVFALLWGYPMMVQGLGYSPQLAALLLVLPVVTGMVLGPGIGMLTARFPLRRSNLVVGIATVNAASWAVLLVWPGMPPMWAVVTVLIITGAATTGSNIGFDFARTFNPASSYGSASGIVNVGGFAASAIAFIAIGMAVDAVSGAAQPNWAAFQLALWTFPVLTLLGILALLLERAKTRNRMAAEEGVVVAPLWAAIARRLRRQHRNWE